MEKSTFHSSVRIVGNEIRIDDGVGSSLSVSLTSPSSSTTSSSPTHNQLSSSSESKDHPNGNSKTVSKHESKTKFTSDQANQFLCFSLEIFLRKSFLQHKRKQSNLISYSFLSKPRGVSNETTAVREVIDQLISHWRHNQMCLNVFDWIHKFVPNHHQVTCRWSQSKKPFLSTIEWMLTESFSTQIKIMKNEVFIGEMSRGVRNERDFQEQVLEQLCRQTQESIQSESILLGKPAEADSLNFSLKFIGHPSYVVDITPMITKKKKEKVKSELLIDGHQNHQNHHNHHEGEHEVEDREYQMQISVMEISKSGYKKLDWTAFQGDSILEKFRSFFNSIQ
eukprot:TRINITY_DN4456_c0_g1_i1.p1 TRINITY_DN4456_c0_g1~~TRINITY_DN4456_c0_g1_i1.p1  ORF type:complete len:337 (+),score=87.92 TRINITY_DN4456_c0_g1_i1:926-1936(+)